MMKRQRGRGRKPGHHNNNQPNRALESNGPDIKVRGPAAMIYEKYMQLARDAASAGDRVQAENYQQHAEHYFRMLKSMQPAYAPPPPPDRFSNDEDFDGEEGGESESSDADGEGGEARGEGPGGAPQGEGNYEQQGGDGYRGGGDFRNNRNNRGRNRRNRFRPDGDRNEPRGDRDYDNRREGAVQEGRGDDYEARPPRERDRERERDGDRDRNREPRAEREPRRDREERAPREAADGEREPRRPRRERREEPEGFAGDAPAFLSED